MRDFRDAKAMALTLRDALKDRSVSLTHSESLELIARILGFHDWNVLSAQIQSGHRTDATGHSAAAPLPTPGGAGLPIVPLRDIVLFPRMIVPLFVGRDGTKRAVEHAMADDTRVLALTQRRAADDNPAPNGLYGVGVVAKIVHLVNLADGTIHLTVESLERVTVSHLAEGPHLTAEVATFEETRGRDTEAFSMMGPVLETLQTYRNGSVASPPIHARLRHIRELREPGALADAVAPLLNTEIDQKQDLLETGDVVRRLEKILALMKTDRQSP
jgi:uncharacterized protein